LCIAQREAPTAALYVIAFFVCGVFPAAKRG
jgi:hypothetical protein